MRHQSGPALEAIEREFAKLFGVRESGTELEPHTEAKADEPEVV
jgi:hypothetical protein